VTAQLALRPYQTEALDVLDAGWAEGLQRVAVVLPTGLGKTVVFAHLIQRALAAGWTPLVLVHREELADQAADKIRSVAPGVTVGIVKAERDELDRDVTVASVQTLARDKRMGRYLGWTTGHRRLVIVDECHHAVARTWIDILTTLGAFRGDGTRVAGFTATMTREDSRKLGDIWERVVYERDILYGISNGFLTDVRGKAVTVDGLDLATVARSRGDYQEGALGEALESSGAGEVIAKAYAEHAGDRQGVLFAPTVATALSFAQDLNAAGITTETITGTTSSEDRALIYKRFRVGDVQVLSNCMVLTEGWDAPWCSAAVIARPTSSAGLYVQMVGRVLRPYPGKTDALVLDVVGVTGRHKLRSLTDLSKTEDLTVLEGESLAEAVERKAREDGRKPATKGRAAGIIGAQDVDLFAASESVWLQTTDGKWFIPTREWTYFLWPEANATTWKVGRVPSWRLSREGVRGGWVREGLEFGYAMAFGEAEAALADPSISKRSASWRKRKAEPSPAQMDMMARWRIPFIEGMTKDQASDLISIAIATKDLARFRYEPAD